MPQMWFYGQYRAKDSRRFFRLMYVNGELMDYLQTNFLLMNEHHFSLSEIENMIPYERHINIMLLLAHLDKKNKKH